MFLLEIILKLKLQSYLLPFELIGQWRETHRGADCCYRGSIQSFRSGRRRDYKFRNISIPIDDELQLHHSTIAEARTFRDNGEPVLSDQ
jgi:hypothetical protein